MLALSELSYMHGFVDPYTPGTGLSTGSMLDMLALSELNNLCPLHEFVHGFHVRSFKLSLIKS